jgi:cathepsin B
MIKVIACVLVVAVLVVADADYFAQPVIHGDLINEINADPTSTWKAGINSIFKGMTLNDVKKKLLGARAINLIPGNFPAPRGKYELQDVPAQFDSRTKWPKCVTIGTIRNQAQCGSCWAFAAAEVLSDRFCIQVST